MANPFNKGKMSVTEKERMDNYEAEEARHKARMAGRHALAAKIRWEAVEKQWLATKEAYTDQAARYENMTGPNATTGPNVATGSGLNATTGTTGLTGILATQDWDGNGINGPQPPARPDRPLSVFLPDPDAVYDTYPAIRRGHWTHGGFPMDPSFGNKGDKYEPNGHSGLHRSADKWTNNALYQPGTIVSMMWHQDYAFDRTWREEDKPFLTLNRQSGVIYSKRRKFIVVARFQEHFIALPIWTSYAKKLAGACYEKQRVEFMQILHQNDSIEAADKFRLTPYDYLYQLEKRLQPVTKGRQTVEGTWHRHLEDEWLDMKPYGEALLWLTYPASFDYRTKCHIIGSLQPNSVEYLLKNWTAQMQRSTLGHLLQVDRTIARNRAIKTDEARQTVDDLARHLHRELNISSERNPWEVWNSAAAVRNTTRIEARRAPLARSLEKLAFALETAQTLVSEATLYGAIYETAVDTMRVMQETRGFLQLLTKIVKDKTYSNGMPSPLLAGRNRRTIGIDSPRSPFSSQWANNVYNTAGSREPGLGEPRFVAPGSELSLTAGQHAQLGHTTENADPLWAFPQVEALRKENEARQKKNQAWLKKNEYPQKKRKIG